MPRHVRKEGKTIGKWGDWHLRKKGQILSLQAAGMKLPEGLSASLRGGATRLAMMGDPSRRKRWMGRTTTTRADLSTTMPWSSLDDQEAGNLIGCSGDREAHAVIGPASESGAWRPVSTWNQPRPCTSFQAAGRLLPTVPDAAGRPCAPRWRLTRMSSQAATTRPRNSPCPRSSPGTSPRRRGG